MRGKAAAEGVGLQTDKEAAGDFTGTSSSSPCMFSHSVFPLPQEVLILLSVVAVLLMAFLG